MPDGAASLSVAASRRTQVTWDGRRHRRHACLRHGTEPARRYLYRASLLTGSGLDVKVVQHRLRHGSARTILDSYGHLWPDSDESARAAWEECWRLVRTGGFQLSTFAGERQIRQML